MAGPRVQIFQNDERVKLYWVFDRTGAYRSWNLYWSTDSGMAGEAQIASNISNVPDGLYSKNDVIYEFDRKTIGQTILTEFYVRVKGVDGSGVEDAANPGPTKLVPATEPDREEYHGSQIYGFDYTKDLWKRVRVKDDGALDVDVELMPGDSGLGAVEIKDHDSETRVNVTDMGGGDGALDVNIVGGGGLTGLDIAIGAIELKDADTDQRVQVRPIGGDTGAGAVDTYIAGGVTGFIGVNTIEIKDADSDKKVNVTDIGGIGALDVNIVGGDGLTGLDIAIGAIELKDADTDQRVQVRPMVGDTGAGAMDVYIAGGVTGGGTLSVYIENGVTGFVGTSTNKLIDRNSDVEAQVRDMGGGEGALDVYHAGGVTGFIGVNTIEIKDAHSNQKVNVTDINGVGALDVNILGSNGLTGLDIQIGAIELKDADSDQRAQVRTILGDTGAGALDVYIAGGVTGGGTLSVHVESGVTGFVGTSTNKIIDHDSDVQAQVRDIHGEGALDVYIAGVTGTNNTLDVYTAGGVTGFIGVNTIEIKDAGSDQKVNVTDINGLGALDVNILGAAGLTGLDIQIGAMELKDATSDIRAVVRDLGGATGTGALDVFIAGATGIDVDIEQYPDNYVTSGSEQGTVALGSVGTTGILRILRTNEAGELQLAGYDATRDAHNVYEVAPVHLQRTTVNLFTSVTLTNAYVYSTEVDCSSYGQGLFYVDYNKGDETSMEFKIQFSPDNSTWYDQVFETIAAPVVTTTKEYSKSASSSERIVVPIADMYIRLGIKATGGTPTGDVTCDLTLGWS